ncbi:MULTISPECIES: hypothetical protein [unclassified Nonomuraea]|uniref:ParB/RepB/Spo0J family partition protein n=1 Tax=unclassified Nonomuraea TaxID=2593643 RepID=UPI0033F362E1
MSVAPLDRPDLIEPEDMRLLRIPIKYLDHYPDNVREDFQLTPAFCKSMVTELQVVLTVIPIPDHHVRQEGEEEFLFWVVKGNRRLAGGRKVKLKDMLCLVDLNKAGDRAKRFLDQVVENDEQLRRPLTPFEEAKALFQAHQAGANRAEMRQRTGRSRQQIADGIRAGRLSEQTTRAAQDMDYAWTVPDLVLLAEFDGNAKALAMIERAVDRGHPVAYAVESVRDQLAEEAAHEKIVAELQASGVRVAPEFPDGALLLPSLSRLLDDFDPDGHADCPGHGAYFRRYDPLQPVYFCSAPTSHGYRPPEHPAVMPASAGSTSGASRQRSETDLLPRKLVVEGRKAWPRAGTVRQAWLAEFFQRKTAPKAVLPFVTKVLLTMPGPVRAFLTEAHHSSLYAKFGGPTDPVKALEGATPGRLAMLLLRVIAVAFEHQMTYGEEAKNTWRSDKYSPCSTEDAALWLRFLVTTLGAELGARAHQPAPIERTLIEGKLYAGDIPQAAVDDDADNEPATEDDADPDVGTSPDTVAQPALAGDTDAAAAPGALLEVGPYSSDAINRLIAEFTGTDSDEDGLSYPEAA